MENIVFERDYEEEHRQQDGNDAASAIFEIATDGGFIAAYADAMQAIPKIVVPADNDNCLYHIYIACQNVLIFEAGDQDRLRSVVV